MTGIPTSAGLEAGAVDGPVEREIGWLIERKFSVNSIGATEPRWYAERPNGDHWWTPVANDAKRFPSKAEAETDPAYQMIAKDPAISLTEHVWINDGFSWSHGRSALIPPSRAVEQVAEFAKAILHGDDEHRAWLTEAAVAFIAGEPLPPPRGKGTGPVPQAVAPTGEIGELIARLLHRASNAATAYYTRVAEFAELDRKAADVLTAISAKLAEVEQERDEALDDAKFAERIATKREIDANAERDKAKRLLAEARNHINRYADTAVEHDLIARIDAIIGGGEHA